QALNVAQVCFLSLVEVVEKSPQSHDGGSAAVGDSPGSVLAELLFRQTAALVGAEAALAVVVGAAVELLPQELYQLPVAVGLVVEDGLGGGEAAQLAFDAVDQVAAIKGGDMGFAGGDVAEAQPRL